ncbi:MAG: class I SAM-dependent methyltransferase [Candidatus Lindowbacteria bacterium]|nr:class I SAM-dependent methyltransferase [Candidatus Lindowbacteria bacterium]
MEHVPCNLCGGSDAAPYCRVGGLQIVRCNACGLFYTNPRRPASEIAKIYSEDYFVSKNPSELGYDDYRSHSRGLKEVFADHISAIEQFVQSPGSILEVGCAYGYFLEIAASRGWTAEGVEVSPFASRIARENSKAPVYTGTLSSAQLPTSRFDAAAMWDMLEHSFDPSSDLSETNRILKPGGYLFMTIPDAGSLAARMMGAHWYGFKKAAEHNYFFSKRTLGQMLSKSGFRLLETRRGVWPCSMRFLVTKLEPYSRFAYRAADRVVRALGIGDTVVKFKFIDMFVIARKESDLRL